MVKDTPALHGMEYLRGSSIKPDAADVFIAHPVLKGRRERLAPER
jgi:hypothetical protein